MVTIDTKGSWQVKTGFLDSWFQINLVENSETLDYINTVILKLINFFFLITFDTIASIVLIHETTNFKL